MTCKLTPIPGGFVVACTRGKARVMCEICKQRPVAKLCDYPLVGAKAGQTCDRKLCLGCAVHTGPDQDLCPAHAKRRADETINQGKAPP